MSARFLLIFATILCWAITAEAQLLLYKKDGEIGLLNLNDKQVTQIKKELTGELTGYSFDGNTVLITISNNGIPDTINFYDREFPFQNCNAQVILKKSGRSFYYDDFVLKEGNHCIVLCKNQQMLWRNGNAAAKCPECQADDATAPQNVYFNPAISSDKKLIVYTDFRATFFSSWTKIFLINAENGQQRVLAKGINPQFSPDDKYILYQHQYNKKYNLIDLRTGKKLMKNFDQAFWICK